MIMEFSNKVFVNPSRRVDEDAEVIFVADLFVEDYNGGAELTSEALIQESPFKVQKIHSRDVDMSTLQQGVSKFWIFGNFSQMNPELIPSIVGNLKYTILEYDYKFCRYRSPEKHKASTGLECDCHEQMNGKLISAFFYGAKAMWWMSEAQKHEYFKRFPFLAEKDNFVLSSVFSKQTLGTLKALKASLQDEEKKGWIVLGSNSWIKGADDAKKWCEDNGKEHEIVWNLPYDKVLAKLASAEGFVYLPKGNDTCPRMVIEAKLLGCKLHVNDYVQHAKEEWFATDDVEEIHEYLFSAPETFWATVKSIVEYKPRISGYTTTLNCVKQEYPFEQSIKSMLQFCDEVCVVDGGSTDGTQDILRRLNHDYATVLSGSYTTTNDFVNESRLKVKIIPRDWDHPRFGVFDGMQKAEARAMCTGDFCWQMDSDEIVHEDDASKVADLATKMPKNIDIVSLPVVEYWGSEEKVRVDIQPWKWRLSRNLPHITHGIPRSLRAYDENGHVYSLPGSDGCDMIDRESGDPLPHVTFHTHDAEKARQAAVNGHPVALEQYQTWFNSVVENLPGVFHYSWYDMPRKIRTYKNYWTKHWTVLGGKEYEDTAETNMMFDVPWSEVTDEMIEKRAEEFKTKTGGWIFHRKWNGVRTPHMIVKKSQPSSMKGWKR